MENISIIEKVKLVINEVHQNEDGTFSAHEGIIYERFMDDPDYETIFKKVENLMKLLESENKNGRLEEFLDRDLETDVWFLI